MSHTTTPTTSESPLRQGLIWFCVAVSVLVAMAQGAVWEHQHDEGTTFDLGIGIIEKGEFVPVWPESPLPVTALYETVEARSDYTVQDAVESVTVPNYRMFHPPGYYVLIHLWTKIFGTSRIPMRLPAYFLGALAILGMVAIARRVIPEATGTVWVALIFGLSPWVLRLENFTRPYHLALFCAVWATVAVLNMQAEGRPRNGWRALFVVLSLIGLYSIYHYAFMLAWHLLLIAWQGWSAGRERRRGEVIALGAMLLGLLAGFAPWLRNFGLHLKVSGNSGDYFTGTVAETHWYTYFSRAFQDFTIGDAIQTYQGRNLATIVLILGAVTLPVVIWAFAGPARRALDSCARRFWISAAAVPLLILASDMVQGGHTIFITKLCFGMIILLVLMVVRAWLALPIAWLRHTGLASWALLFVVCMSFNTYTRAAEPSSMEDAAAVIAQADTDDHLVVLSTDLRGYSAPFLLSLRDAGVGRVFVVQAPGHKGLTELMKGVTKSTRFSRVSLVNFKIPAYKGQMMWEETFVRREVVVPAREGKEWLTFWHNRQPWMGPGAPLTDNRAPTRMRELWVLGPVRAQFYSSPIVTEEDNEDAKPARRRNG